MHIVIISGFCKNAIMKIKTAIIYVIGLLFIYSCAKKIDQTDGTYMPYIYNHEAYTPIPKGYEPFYLNYVGRHGPHYPITAQDIELLIGILVSAVDELFLTCRCNDLFNHLRLIL